MRDTIETNGTSRQRESAELIVLLERGCTRTEVAAWTVKVLEWAEATVAATPRQTHVEGYAIDAAACRIRDGRHTVLNELRL